MAVWMVNPHGVEVIVGDMARRQMEIQGKMHLFKRRAMKLKGEGRAEDVLIDIRQNGIGDDIHCLPGVYQKVQDGFNVTVVGRSMNAAMFERMGCTFVSESDTNGEYIKDSMEKFGTLYSLKNWCTEHDYETRLSGAFKERFQQFADFIDVKLPAKFNWKPFLLGIEYANKTTTA